MGAIDYPGGFLGVSAMVPSRSYGDVHVEAAPLSDAVDGDLVACWGDPFRVSAPLLRIQSECCFGLILDSTLCDCREQLERSLELFVRARRGILVYLRVDGRGAGLAAKVVATGYQARGLDTYDASVHIGVNPEAVSFEVVGAYLRRKGLRSATLLTNNPAKVIGLEKAGLTVRKQHLVVQPSNRAVRRLYQTKAERFGHDIPEELWKSR